VETVVTDYYGVVAAERKLASAQQGVREAQQFLDITRQEEAGGEVAHSDVVKAQIQVNQRVRDAQEAELTLLKSRMGLSVLLFPDFRDVFSLIDDLQLAVPLPALAEFSAVAASGANPDVRAAVAAVQQEASGIGIARGS